MQMLERSSTKFLILQKEKPKLREGKWLVKGHPQISGRMRNSIESLEF